MTSGSPDISVVMPVRNGGRYVAAAVGSVLAQDGVDLEVVLVDDGSTDGTREEVERLADPRVRIVSGPHQGVAAAMNAGLAETRGRYIARCDGDDLFMPSRLAVQMAFLEANPQYGAVCGRFERLDPEGVPMAVPPAAGDEAREISQDLCKGRVEVHFCTYLVRREPMLATGGFRSYFRTSSDIDFQLLLCQRTRVWYEPQTWYGYRIHDDSLTHRHSLRLQAFYEDMARQFQHQRLTRGSGPGKFGADDLQLGKAPTPPEQGEATHVADRPSAREQLWIMRWGEAWREHSEGRRGVALLGGLRATMQQPWRPSAWKGLIALGIKPIAPLPDYRTASSHDGAAAPGAAVSANADGSGKRQGEAEPVQDQFPTHVDQGRRAERPVERLMAS